MKCHQCGNECSESALFCNVCGAKLIKEETPPSVDVTSDTVIEPQPISEVEVADTPSAVPKKSKLPLLIATIVAGVVIIGLGIVFGKSMIKTDYDKLTDAMLKTEEVSRFDLVGEVGFNEFTMQSDDPIQKALVENIIKGAKVNYGIKVDKTEKEVEGKLGFNLSGSKIFDINFHMNDTFVALEMPKLYSKVVYMNWKDVKSTLIKYDLATDEDMNDLDIDRVIQLLSSYKEALNVEAFDSYKKFDKKPYDAIMDEYKEMFIKNAANGKMELAIDGETYTYSGKVYDLNTEMEKYIDLLIKGLKIAIADESILPILKEGTERIVNTAVEEKDIYVYNMIASANGLETVSEWNKDMENTLNDMKDEFIDQLTLNYDQTMTDIEDSMDDDRYLDTVEAVKELYSEIQYTAQYMVEDGYVKGSEVTITVDDSIIDAMNDLAKVSADPSLMPSDIAQNSDIFFTVSAYIRTAYVSIDEKIEFADLPSSAVDFSAISDDEMMVIYQEIMGNVQALTQSLGGL